MFKGVKPGNVSLSGDLLKFQRYKELESFVSSCCTCCDSPKATDLYSTKFGVVYKERSLSQSYYKTIVHLSQQPVMCDLETVVFIVENYDSLLLQPEEPISVSY